MTTYLRKLRSTLPIAGIALLLTLGANAASQQSPLDIRSENVFYTQLPALNFSYGTTVTLDVVNTGSPSDEATVRANVPAGAASVTLAGVTYKLLQFHFHTKAEHLIDGHQAAMELHLVHQADDGTLLVVGRFIEPGDTNALLAPIFSDLPQNTTQHKPVGPFSLPGLLPADLSTWRYPGSLTTPPFSEGVQWNVLAAPITLSQSQIDAFRALFPDGNSRPIQDLNGRAILTDIVGVGLGWLSFFFN
jgi:carbonic anhydrase